MASVVAINLSPKKGTFKYPIEQAHLLPDFGIEGDAHAGKWHRQVSLLGQESVDKMIAMGVPDLTPGKFAENITTQGIDLVSPAGRHAPADRRSADGSHPRSARSATSTARSTTRSACVSCPPKGYSREF